MFRRTASTRYPVVDPSIKYTITFNLTHGMQSLTLSESDSVTVAQALAQANDLNDEFMAIGGVGEIPQFIVNLHHLQYVTFNRVGGE